MSKSKIDSGSGVFTPADEKRAVRKSILGGVKMPPTKNYNPNYGKQYPNGEIDIEFMESPDPSRSADPIARDPKAVELDELRMIPEKQRTPEQVKRLDELMNWEADNWDAAQPPPVY